MTIKEICDILRSKLYNSNFEYGFIVDGIKYKPNMQSGFDKEYYNLSMTIYTVQDPEVTINDKIGTCVDSVLLMKSLLDNLNVPCKIWLLYNKLKNKAHTIVTFAAEEKIVYLELTPQSSKPWYGKEIVYSNEKEFFSDYEKNGFDVSDVTDLVVVGQPPYFLLNKIQYEETNTTTDSVDVDLIRRHLIDRGVQLED